MSVSVRIPTILRTYTGGESEVTANGDTLAAILDDLDSNYAGITEICVPSGVAVPRLSRKRTSSLPT